MKFYSCILILLKEQYLNNETRKKKYSTRVGL